MVSCLWCNVVTQLHLVGEEIWILEESFTNHCQDFLYDLSVFFFVYICFFSPLFISWFHGMVCVTSSTVFWVLGLMIFFASLFFWGCFGVFFWWTKGINYGILWSSSMMKITKKHRILLRFQVFWGTPPGPCGHETCMFSWPKKNISRESFCGWNTIGLFFRKSNISRSKIALNIFVLRNI